MFARIIVLLLCCLQILGSTGCAMMVHGTTQDVEVEINPEDTNLSVWEWDLVQIDQGELESRGKINLPRPPRGRSYVVVASREGYCPQYWITEPTESSASYLDMLWLPVGILLWVIVTFIDVQSGATYDVHSGPLTAELRRMDACI